MRSSEPYPGCVNATQVTARQGKVTIVVGVAALLSGFVLQAIAAHSFATQPPPEIVSNAGTTALLGEIAGFVILGGVILTIVGIFRYAQSGGDGFSVIAPAPVGQTGVAAPGGHVGPAENTARVSTAFCSACGSRIVGVGRYCSACGTPTPS